MRHGGQLSGNAHALLIFLLFLAGAFFQFATSGLLLSELDFRWMIFGCGAIIVASYLTYASYYGYILIPVLCFCDGILIRAVSCSLAHDFVPAAFIMLCAHVPGFFIITQQGLVNAQLLKRDIGHWKKPDRKGLLLATVMMLANTFGSYWVFLH